MTTVRAEVAGAAEAAEMHGPVEIAGIVRRPAMRVRKSCEDGALHAHRDHDGPKARWSIPLVCALAWNAGHGAARQRTLCPLCMVLARAAPRVGPLPRR
jgi:hypothetical protein